MSIQLDPYGFKHDYQPADATPLEAAMGAALVASDEWQEALGADMFRTGVPVEMCETVAMRRGWQAAFDAATLEEQLAWQIEANAAQIAANRERIEAVR